MATGNISQVNTACDAKAQDVAALELAIRDIDDKVHSQMGDIAAVAEMAMRWLQSPVETVGHYETVYQALAMIREKARFTNEEVCWHATSVECATLRTDRLLNALPA